MNKNEALKAIRNGAIAACISGTLTLIVVLIAMNGDNKGALAPWNDPFIFFDVVIIFICAIGLYRKARAAAITLLLYFILSKIYISLEMGQPPSIPISLLFLYFYGKAIQGTFIYHKLEKAENSSYQPSSAWHYLAGIPAILVLIFLVTLSLLSVSGFIPSTKVQSGDELSQHIKDQLLENSIIYADDKIRFFYSDGFTSILESGSVLTQDRVILYISDENQQLEIYEIYVNDIATIELIEKGDILNDSIYQINAYTPDAWLQIVLSTENKGDEIFIEALKENINEQALLTSSHRLNSSMAYILYPSLRLHSGEIRHIFLN